MTIRPSKHTADLLFDTRAQTAAWGLLIILTLIVIASGLVDVYSLYAARNWAYSVAQEAALTGVSKGRDWSSLTSGSGIKLNSSTAKTEAQNLVIAAMNRRGIPTFSMDVRILPDPTGGSITGYPPNPVRLGSSLGNWSSSEPAVGVYLEVPVRWMLLDLFAVQTKTVKVFASAGVSQ